LPVRIHDLLLSLAGRLDDDALADARQMLASAELDRSLEYIAGCLVAGRVALSKTQHDDLEGLFADTYLDPALIDRLVVMDPVPMGRHQFAIGAVDGREPDRGVADAIRSVLNVLPDVRSVWCVWRLTPAGPVSGPVPHRVVLVGVGPGGFAPATAYRVEYALRHAGIRASVEVLVDGHEASPYHQEAMRCAQQVPFDEPGVPGPSMSPVEPARAQPFGAAAPAAPSPVEPRPVGRPLGPVRTEAPGEHALPPSIEPPSIEPPSIEPPSIEPPSMESPPVEPHGAHALPPPVELRPVAPVEPPAELPPPVTLHPAAPERSMPTPPRGTPPQAVQQHGPQAVAPSVAPARHPASVADLPPGLLPGPVPMPKPTPRPQAVPNPMPRPVPEAGPGESTAVFAREQLPEAPGEPDSALHLDTPTNSRPSPRRRSKGRDGTRPRLLPATRSNSDGHTAAFGDDVLNTQERNLLRELQDELARREQQDQGGPPEAWFGQNAMPGFDTMPPGQQPMINGTPPSQDGRGYPPAT
jgi:hypothetical protein